MSKYIYSGRYIGRGPHSDRHVTVASHQPLKNFQRKNDESNYCFSPTCVGLGFQLVDIILDPVPSTKIDHPQLCGKHKTDRSNYYWMQMQTRPGKRHTADQITLSSPISFSLHPGSKKREQVWHGMLQHLLPSCTHNSAKVSDIEKKCKPAQDVAVAVAVPRPPRSRQMVTGTRCQKIRKQGPGILDRDRGVMSMCM